MFPLTFYPRACVVENGNSAIRPVLEIRSLKGRIRAFYVEKRTRGLKARFSLGPNGPTEVAPDTKHQSGESIEEKTDPG